MDYITLFLILMIVAIVGYIVYIIVETIQHSKEYIAELEKEKERIKTKTFEKQFEYIQLLHKYEDEKNKRSKNGPVSKCDKKSKKRNVGKNTKSLSRNKK